MKKLILVLIFSLLTSTSAFSAWYYDGYSFSSNICRNGSYWQVVHWNYVGTDCYMPMWNGWGKRVIE